MNINLLQTSAFKFVSLKSVDVMQFLEKASLQRKIYISITLLNKKKSCDDRLSAPTLLPSFRPPDISQLETWTLRCPSSLTKSTRCRKGFPVQNLCTSKDNTPKRHLPQNQGGESNLNSLASLAIELSSSNSTVSNASSNMPFQMQKTPKKILEGHKATPQQKVANTPSRVERHVSLH